MEEKKDSNNSLKKLSKQFIKKLIRAIGNSKELLTTSQMNSLDKSWKTEQSNSTVFITYAYFFTVLNTHLQGTIAGPTSNKGFYGIIQKIPKSEYNFSQKKNLDHDSNDNDDTGNNSDSNDKDQKTDELSLYEHAQLIIATANNKLKNLIELEKNAVLIDLDSPQNYIVLINAIIENVFTKALNGPAADAIYTAALAEDIVKAIKDKNYKKLEQVEKLMRINNPIGADALKAFGIALVIGTTCFLLAPLVLHVGVSGAIALGALKLFHSIMLSNLAVSAVPALAMGAVSFGLFRSNAAHGNKAGADAINDFKNWVVKI